MTVGTQLRIELEHVGENKGIGLVNRVENAASIMRRSVKTRATIDELSHPVVLVVKRVLNEFCMELFEMVNCSDFGENDMRICLQRLVHLVPASDEQKFIDTLEFFSCIPTFYLFCIFISNFFSSTFWPSTLTN